MRISCTLMFVVLLQCVLAGCRPENTEISKTSQNIQTASLTTQRLSTPTPISLFTATLAIIPESSATHSLATRSNIPKPTPTTRPTVVPTLEIEDAYARLLDLMQNNGSCDLPCWWGINPGVSTFTDADTQLMPLVGISDFYYAGNKGGIGITYPANDLLFSLYLEHWSITTPGTAVDMIYVSTDMLRYIDRGGGNFEFQPIYDSDTYNQLVGNYTLSGMLSAYGPPSKIIVRTALYNPPAPEFMVISLLYPGHGIFASYTMHAEREDKAVLGCPTKSFVSLWLLPPQANGNYEEYLSLSENWDGNLFFLSLTEATQMTVDGFYQMFVKPSQNCVETPIKLWPQP